LQDPILFFPHQPEAMEIDRPGANISIEHYVARRDPYRSTTSALPLPFPWKREHAPDHVYARFNPIRNSVRQCVRELGVPASSITLGDLTKPGYPEGEEPVTTLCIEVQEQQDNLSFVRIRDAIREMLASHNMSDIPVEVYDRRKIDHGEMFAIDPDEPGVAPYKAVRGQIIQLLFKELDCNWNAISLFHVGRLGESASPAIVVMVPPRLQHDWDGLETRIKSLLPQCDAMTSLNVRIFPGGKRQLNDLNILGSRGVSYGGRINNECLPKMGWSINRKGREGSGTLGGFLTLNIRGKCHQGFLTCHHVISSDQREDRQGILYSDPDEEKPVVESLATEDVVVTKNDLRETIEYSESLLEDNRISIQRRQWAQKPPSEGLESIQASCVETIRSCNCKLVKLDKMPMTLGRVLLSSGCALANRRTILDWAFVELAKPLEETIFLPNVLPPISTGMRAANYGRVTVQKPSCGVARGLDSIVPGEWYFKCGRTTDMTAGICNGVEVNCPYKGKEGPQCTEEYAIMGKKQKGKREEDVAFCEAGDSGAFVFNARGELCGLLYGSFSGGYEEGQCVDAGLVTCMTQILPSIATKAGVEVNEVAVELPF
jgi:hypothetical protein